MPQKQSDAVLAFIVDLVHEQISQAAETAKAAKACAEIDNLDEAIRITFAIEQPLYEANALLTAAALIKRRADD